MRLSARILKNVANVNHWEYANQAFVFEGQANEIYIQIVDLAKNPAITRKSDAFPENPLRYMSQATVLAVEAIFENIDDSQEFTIAGTQPFTDDKSIWKFTLTATQLPNSGNFKIKITEDAVEKTFLIVNGIKAELLEVGGC